MRGRFHKTLVGFLLTCGLYAQEAGLTARGVYYDEERPRAAPPVSAPPPKSKPRADAIVKPTAKEALPLTTVGGAVGRNVSQEAGREKGPTHLGVRYNLLKVVNRETGAAVEVDSDYNFKPGDCVLTKFRPNRSGFLYAFNAASSGAWQPMIPNPLMPNERNSVGAGETLTVPGQHCFQIENPPGVESLLVVVTERQQDFLRLNDSIRKTVGSEHSPAGPPDRSVDSRKSQLTATLEDFGAPRVAGNRLISRDLSIQRIGQPLTADEPPHSVYVVKTSAAPEDRIVIRINIRHE